MDKIFASLSHLQVQVQFEVSGAPWHVGLMWYPLGWFHGRADCPKAAFAAAWDSWVEEMFRQTPDWLFGLQQLRARWNVRPRRQQNQVSFYGDRQRPELKKFVKKPDARIP